MGNASNVSAVPKALLILGQRLYLGTFSLLVLFVVEGSHPCRPYPGSPLICSWVFLGERQIKGCLSLPPSGLRVSICGEIIFVWKDTIFQLQMYECFFGQRRRYSGNRVISLQTSEVESNSSQHLLFSFWAQNIFFFPHGSSLSRDYM